tara:strand:+ start:284 stop:868 length:585 start_codon:yes stop_codon:yes gene_type:complete
MPFILDHNLLFVHIPKTGGSSIEKKFDIDKQKRDECFSYTEQLYNNIIFAPQHFTPDLIEKHYPKLYKKCKKFTIVRNPYTKMISEFIYREGEFTPDKFHNFVERIPLQITDHNLPQKRYFNNNIFYSQVLRFEHLKSGFEILANSNNFSSSLPHENKSGINTSDLVSEIKRETLDLLNNYYAEDFEFLKYKMI